jgi:hypothetical protein
VPKHREKIVKRVVQALDETRDLDTLVWSYFDEDRDVVIEAARQTLEAREYVSAERVAAVVDKELIDALRFPTRARASVAISLYLHRGKVALGSAAVTIGGLLAWLLI